MVTSIETHTIMGFKFAFSFSSFANGITISPDLNNINDPDFLEALELACEMYPYLEAEANLDFWEYNGDYILDQSPSKMELLDDLDKVNEGFLLGYITEVKDYSRVFEYIRGNLQKPKREPYVKPRQRGYVYVLRSASGEYKIGRAKNPADRLKTFGVQLPFKVAYELVISSDDYKLFEAQLHERFVSKRTAGEWFDLTQDDIESLRIEFAERLWTDD